jgi:hypothetical protein
LVFEGLRRDEWGMIDRKVARARVRVGARGFWGAGAPSAPTPTLGGASASPVLKRPSVHEERDSHFATTSLHMIDDHRPC